MNLLNIAQQGVIANQNALATTGQNISNVNTDGYTRQRVNFQSQENFGGVQVTDIDRITDQILTRQLWSDVSTYNQSSTFATLSAQLDNLLAQQTTSVSDAIDNYFSALQNAVDDPVSGPNRELFIAETEALVQRVNSLDQNLRAQEENVNLLIDDYTQQISTIAGSIADVNAEITIATAGNRPTNELEDQRDQLVNDLSKLVSVNVVEEGNTGFNVFLANGQPLVVGNAANQLISTTGIDNVDQRSVQLVIAGQTLDVSDQLSGGELGGVLRYREESLNDARDELGRIAIVLSETMNQQHQSGIDANNNYGGNIFNDVNSSAAQSSRVATFGTNGSTLLSSRVSIEDVSLLQASDYELVYGSENQISLIRKEDGKVFDIDQLTPSTHDRTVNGNAINTAATITTGAAGVTAASENITVTRNGVALPAQTVDSAKDVADALNATVGVSGVTATTAIGFGNVTDPGADGASYSIDIVDNAGNPQTLTVNLPAGGTDTTNSKTQLDGALEALTNAGVDVSNINIEIDGTDVKLTDNNGENISFTFASPSDANSVTLRQYTDDTTAAAGTVLTAGTATESAVVTGYLDAPQAVADGSITSLSVASTGTTYLGAASVNVIDNTNNVASTIADADQGVADVSEGEVYIDQATGTLAFQVDGIKVVLDVANTFSNGDRFAINAVRTGATDFSRVIQDGDQLALASPVRISPAEGNQGTGVASVSVTNPDAAAFGIDGQLRPPVEIVFNNADPVQYTVLDISEPTNPVPLDLGNGPLVNQTFQPGQVIALDGYEVTIANQPLAGDRFTFTFNQDGISDNRNALAISNLQNAAVVGGDDYQDLYGSLIERIGSNTATAFIATDASKAVLDATTNARASISGVNLDEEAARLIQFQQAYQANAQLIQVSQTLFDSLLSAVR